MNNHTKGDSSETKIWFVSDLQLHFSHKNILKFCPNTRLGVDIEEHDEILIQNWQKQVDQSDHVYCLGDVFFCNSERAKKIMNRLPGQIHLIYGNHDKVIKSNHDLRSKFVSVDDYKEITVEGTKVCLFHFPMIEFNRIHHGAFHLFGHVHGGRDNDPIVKNQKMMDVGVDGRPDGICQDYGPMFLWEWKQVKRILDKRPIGVHHKPSEHRMET